MKERKTKKHILRYVLISFTMLIVLSLSISSLGSARENKIVLTKVVDLKESPECDLLDKDKLPTPLYTIEDSNGNKYFCLNEFKHSPNGTEYDLDNCIEVTSDSVRWLIYNYYYNPSYFGDTNDLTAYGATQIAIWHYTENQQGTPDYEKNNPLVMKLIQDSSNVSFPSLQDTLSSFQITMKVENPMLVLEGNEYIGTFSVNIDNNISTGNALISLSPYHFTVKNGLTTIENGEGVIIEEISKGLYSIRINQDFVDPNDPIVIECHANVTGESLVIVEAFPDDARIQAVGYTDVITLSQPLNAYVVFEIEDIILGGIGVTKVDQNNNPVEGAEFTLTDNQGESVTASTKKDGTVFFVIDEGETYTLEETKTPEGYTGSFKQEGITLENDGQIFTYTAVNKLKEGSIQVTKVDQNNHPVPGAEFVLMDDTNHYVEGISNEQGLIIFPIVANKTYTLEEVKTPEGYAGSFKQEGITLENDGQIFTYTVVNEKLETSSTSSENTSTPTSSENTSTPTSSENISTPTSSENISTPTSSENISTPTSSKNTQGGGSLGNDQGGAIGGNNQNGINTGNHSPGIKAPNTGDSSHLSTWLMILVSSLMVMTVAIIGSIVYLKKQNKKI